MSLAPFESIRRYFEDIEFEKWRVKIQNETLIEGLDGNEWKIKQIDRAAANRFGLWFPLDLSDEEYALLFCKCLLKYRDPWLREEALKGAEEYLEKMEAQDKPKVVSYSDWIRSLAR